MTPFRDACLSPERVILYASHKDRKNLGFTDRKNILLIKGGCAKLVQMTGVSSGTKHICSKTNSLGSISQQPTLGNWRWSFWKKIINKGVTGIFFFINARGLSVKPSLIHSCIAVAQITQRLERECMWRNRTTLALKWHKPSSPSSSQGLHTSVPQSSAGQLRWREISSNEMEDENSGEIAPNKVKSGSWRDKQLHLQ